MIEAILATMQIFGCPRGMIEEARDEFRRRDDEIARLKALARSLVEELRLEEDEHIGPNHAGAYVEMCLVGNMERERHRLAVIDGTA